MIFFKAFLTALSTYSAIPVPRSRFDERTMKYAICFFPAVGVIIGVILLVWYKLSAAAGLSGIMFSAVASALPVIITGGIHLDGYMDTVDAICSHRERERKLEIMKDPHTGAFALIYIVVYFIIYFALTNELYILRAFSAAFPVFIISRALSAFLALRLPNARGMGMLLYYTESTEKSKAELAALITAAAACVLMIIISPPCGIFAAVLSVLWVLLYTHTAMKQFGGVTGDTAGFFLEVCELLCLAGVLIGALIR